MEPTAAARIVRTSPLTRSLLAPNPGVMSLEGTNSYLLGGPDRVVVVDPGPLDRGHLRALAAEAVELILITHRHADHTAGSAELHRLTGAPVRAFSPDHCLGGSPVVDGELIEAAGVQIEVLATPGHTSDSVCFRLAEDGPAGSVLTGDTILGRGTTVLDHPDGTLREYLDSLERLSRLGPAAVLPAHGPVLPDLAEACQRYREHRHHRLEEIRGALAEIGAEASVEEVASVVYRGIEPALRGAAEKSVRAQLEYLRGL